MSIRELLVALNGAGRVHVQEVLEVTRIDPATGLGAHTVDDRRCLTRALAGLVGARPNRRRSACGRAAVARQDGAPAARNEAGDGPAPARPRRPGAAMPRPSHQPAFLVEDPTRAEQRQALWRMSPAERITAMYRGDLTLVQCLAWAARYPEQVPTLNGEWWFIAIRTPDIADLDDAHDEEGEQR